MNPNSNFEVNANLNTNLNPVSEETVPLAIPATQVGQLLGLCAQEVQNKVDLWPGIHEKLTAAAAPSGVGTKSKPESRKTPLAVLSHLHFQPNTAKVRNEELDMITSGKSDLANHNSKATRMQVARGRRPLLIALTLTMLISGIVLFVPPAKTWASQAVNSLFEYLGFTRTDPTPIIYKFTDTTVPTGAKVIGKACEANPDNKTEMLCRYTYDLKLTLTQIQNQVDFPVKLPTYVPGEYQANAGLEYQPETSKAIRWQAEYTGKAGFANPCVRPRSIELAQIKAGDIKPGYQYPVGNVNSSEVKVGEVTGLWFEKLTNSGACNYSDAQGNGGTVETYYNLLVWEQAGIRYALMSDPSLSREEALKIVNSLS